MSGDLVVQGQATPVHRPTSEPSQELVQVRSIMGIPPGEWQQMWATAQVLAGAGKMVPEPLRQNPEGFMGVGLRCHALGLPFDIRSATGGHFHVWEDRGKIVIQESAQLMLGLMHRAGHEAWWGPCDHQTATLHVKRAGSEREEPFTWTAEDTNRAGLEGKDNWKKYPQAMSRHAVARMACRFMAPEALLGLDSYEAAVTQVGYQPPAALDADTYELGAGEFTLPAAIEGGPGYQPPPPASPEARQRIRAAIRSLSPERIQRVALAWADAKLPHLDNDSFSTTDAVDASQLVLDVMATPVDQEEPCPSASAPPTGATAAASAPGGDGSSTDTAGRPPARPASTDASAASGSATAVAGSEPARPLAQQIAIQAKAAGVDHHNVISAVTGGDKTSAAAVDNEEGELVLLAIGDLAAGKFVLVERDGKWSFGKPTAADEDLGRAFE